MGIECISWGYQGKYGRDIALGNPFILFLDGVYNSKVI
jgi:hypothetical protein